MQKVLYLLLGLLLSSCVTIPQQEAPSSSPKSASSPPPPPKAVTVTEAPVITMVLRSYLKSDEMMKDAPVSLIFLPRKPVTKAEQMQYEAICEIWQASFPLTSSVQTNVEEMKDIVIVPFYWLTNGKAKTETCKDLVKNYDYLRAQVFARKNKLITTRVQILTQIPAGVITMNLTSVKKKDDLVIAMDTWQTKMTRMPSKPTNLYAIDLVTSARQVLGVLGSLIAFKSLTI
ncbi:MAG: hypothetical protein ACXWJK_04925 [Burkholderiaceae bacterium]